MVAVHTLNTTTSQNLIQSTDTTDPAKSAKEHEAAGHKSVQLAFALRGLYEAYAYIKQATNARQEGRYQKAKLEGKG